MLVKSISTYTGLFLLGDIGAQTITAKKKNHEVKIDQNKLKFTFMWGIVGGAAVHYWYAWLDNSFKYNRFGRYLGTLGKIKPIGYSSGLLVGKVCLDLAFDAPLYGAYLWGSDKYNCKNKTPKEFWNSFINMYTYDLGFWLPANYVNFFHIPNKYRILYVSGATALWSCILPLVSDEEH